MSNPLNKISQVYLDQVANVKKAENKDDVQRWTQTEAKVDTGSAEEKATARNKRNTPAGKDYKFDTSVFITRKPGESLDSARTRTRQKAHAKKRGVKESFSNWRTDLSEVIDTPTTDTEDLKQVKEVSGIKNKVIINPKLTEAIGEIGGELLEVTELSDVEDAVDFFYEEGISEEGIDLIIEEVGLEEFIDFVTDTEFLTEAKRVKGGGPYPAKKMNVRTLKATKKKAEEIKADKSDVVKRGTPADTVARARAERSFKKPKLAKPSPKSKKDYDGDGKKETPKQEHRGVRNKKITKAVAKVKKTQPKKTVSKDGIRDRIQSAVAAGVKRHRKATQPVRVFHKGMKAGARKAVKFAKDVHKAVNEEVKGEDTERRKAASADRRSGERISKKEAPSETKKFVKNAERTIKWHDKVSKGKFTPGEQGDTRNEEVEIDERVSPEVSGQLHRIRGGTWKRRFARGGGRVHTGGSKAIEPKHTATSTRAVDTSKDAQTGVDSVSGEYKSAEQRKREHKANVARQRAAGASMRGEGFSDWKNELIEKDLNAAERRALPDKEFALPGKGKGPEGKQAGSYPIPDKNHARMALAMVAKHGTPEKQAKVRAAVEKKFPGIKVSEELVKPPGTSDAAVDKATRKTGFRPHANTKPPKLKVAEDRILNNVVSRIRESATNPKKFDMEKFKQGLRDKEGAVFHGDPGTIPSEAEKKKNAKEYAAHKAKIAAQDTRDDLEKSSQGRYSRKYSNRGSD